MTTYGAIKARQFEYYNPTSGQTANPWREEIDRDNVYRMKRSNGTSYNTIMRIDPTNTSGNATAASDQTFLITAASGQTNPVMSVLDENSSTLMNVTSTVNTRNVIPRSDDTYSLGTDELKFGTVYTDSLNFTNQSGSTTGTQYPAGNNISTHQPVSLYNDNGTAKAKVLERIGLRGGTSLFDTNVSYASVAALDANRVVVAYQDVSDGSFVKVRVGTVLNKHIVWGNPYVAFAENLGECQIVKLDTNKALVVGVNGSTVRSRELNVIGDSFSMTSVESPSIGTPTFMKLSTISTTDALLTFKDSDNQFKGVLYSGTWSSPVTIKGVAVGDHPSSVVVDATTAVGVYTVGTNLHLVALTLSPSLSVSGTEQTVSGLSTSGDFTDVCIPAANGIVAVARSTGGTPQAVYVAGTTGDNYDTMSLGSLAAVDGTDVASNLNLVTVSTNNVALVGSNTTAARGYIGNVSGPSVTWGVQSTGQTSSSNVYVTPNFNTIAVLNDDRMVVVGNASGGVEEGWSRFAQRLNTNDFHWANEWDLTDSTEYVAIEPVTDTDFLMAYPDTTNSKNITVRMGRYINGVLTLGTEVSDAEAINGANLFNFTEVGMAKISNTEVMIAYGVGVNFRARIITISGLVPSFETSYVIASQGANLVHPGIELKKVSDTRVLVSYFLSQSPDWAAIVIKKAGTVLSTDANQVIINPLPGLAAFHNIFAMSEEDNHYIISAKTDDGGQFYRNYAVRIVDTTINSSVEISALNGTHGVTTSVRKNQILNMSWTGSVHQLRPLKYSAEGYQAGSDLSFTPSGVSRTGSLVRISDTRVLAIYPDNGVNIARIIDLVDNTPVDSGISFTLDFGQNTSPAKLLNATTVLIPFFDGDSMVSLSAIYPRNDILAGIAQTTATIGNNVGVKLLGERSTGHSGLSIGATYYVALDGTLTLEETDVKAGVALTDTEIFIRRD